VLYVAFHIFFVYDISNWNYNLVRLMKLFENMDPLERDIAILKAVEFSVSLEGMDKAAQECQIKIERLHKLQKRKLKNYSDRTSMGSKSSASIV